MRPPPTRRGAARLLTDAALARRAQDGSRTALAEIYARHGDDLFRFCRAMLRDPEEAEDALQNTMLKVVGNLPGERREIELKPWLYRIARNESIELVRRRRPVAEEVEVPAAVNVAETAEQRERLARLLDDLAELPDRQRAALLMREIGGLGFGEVARAIGASEGAARQVVYEARLGLRQMEEGREMTCDSVARILSDNDGRIARRRDLRAHLRSCPDCRALAEGIASRRANLAAISPLPAGAAAALLQGALGAGAGGVAAGTLVKSAATVAVVAAVGAGAADRSGLVEIAPRGQDTPAPRAAGDSPATEKSRAAAAAGPAVGAGRSSRDALRHPSGLTRREAVRRAGQRNGSGAPTAASDPVTGPAGNPSARRGAPPGSGRPSGVGTERAHGRATARGGPPSAAAHGQAVAESHRSAAPGRSREKAGAGGGRGKGRPAAAAPPAAAPAEPTRPATPQAPHAPEPSPSPASPERVAEPSRGQAGATGLPESP